MKIQKNKSLKNLNTYKISVKARFFIEIKNKKDVLEIFDFIKKNKMQKYFILGGGSNIIFKNEFFDGLVIKNSAIYTKWISSKKVKVSAGRVLDDFLNSLQKKGFYDIQSLAGIPGSVGGAVFGNAGAFGREIRSFVDEVEVYNVKKQRFEIITHNDLNFSYRSSFLKENRNDFVLLSVMFNFNNSFLSKDKNENEYFSLRHFAKKYNLGNLRKVDIRKSILKIRREVYPNLKKYPNVGSSFKNAETTKVNLKKIQKKYSDIPNWDLPSGKVKIPTAYIFDKILHLNGQEIGNIKIDEKRPLFFINTGKATGQEFCNLCQKISKDVYQKTKIKIEPEVFFVD